MADSLSQKTLQNAAYGFLGYFYPILFSILVLPIVVKHLGATEYGIYVFVITISGFIGLLDLGTTTALIKYLSAHHARGEFDEAKRYMRAANAIYLGIGIVGFLVFLGLGSLFLHLLHLPAHNKSQLLIVFALGGLTFFINSAMTIFDVIPAALQRYDMVTKVSIFQVTTFNSVILVAVLLGGQLKIIMLASLLTIIAAKFYMMRYAKQLWPDVSLAFFWDAKYIIKLYKFGLIAAIANLSNNALVYFDRLLIPFYLGPVQLSYYSLPGNVALKTSGLTNSLAITIFPMTSSLAGIEDYEKIKVVYRRVFRNITVIAGAMTTAIGFFSYKILYFWLGRAFADAGSTVLVILAITYFILALYAPLYNFLLGINKAKFLGIAVGCMAIINVISLVILLPRYGIVGAALAYLISVLPVAGMFYWTETKFLKLTGQVRFYLELYGKNILVAGIISILLKFVVLGWTTSLVRLIIAGPCAVLSYLVLYYIFNFFHPEDTESMKIFFQSKMNVRLKKLFS